MFSFTFMAIKDNYKDIKQEEICYLVLGQDWSGLAKVGVSSVAKTRFYDEINC